MNYPEIVSGLVKANNTFDALAWASARINLLGEHIDYNQGFVMPASIQFKTVASIKLNNQNCYRFFSEQYDDVSITKIEKQFGSNAWVNYMLGVMAKLMEAELQIPYFDCTIKSDIPVGAGLSSSAALSCSFALALNNVLKLKYSLSDLAKIAQWSEHEYAGVKCGLMDQTASLLGKQNHILIMDCITNEIDAIPLTLSKEKFILFDTGVKHMLDNSAYNKRRIACETGLKQIKNQYPEVLSFRDVNLQMLNAINDEEIKTRCLYVIQEIERTQLAVSLIKSNNLKALGGLMFATHQGLSKLYEVSCEETDFIVDELSNHSTVFGARMMGAGFGGCVLALVDAEKFNGKIENIKQRYHSNFSQYLKHYEVEIQDASGFIVN